MAPKRALPSRSASSGPGVGGDLFKTGWILEAGIVAACSPRNEKKTRSLDGMLARWSVTIAVVLMLMMQSSVAADGENPKAVLPQSESVVLFS